LGIGARPSGSRMAVANPGGFRGRRVPVECSGPIPNPQPLIPVNCYTNRFNMAVSKELLEILVCPVCKAGLDLKPDGSGLKCVECRRVYPIRDDIPVMLVDEAKIEE